MSLLPFEIGGTLFDVSGKALLRVFAGEEELLEFAFEAEGFGEGDFGAGDDGTLDAADGPGGFVGRAELAGVGEDVVPEGVLFVKVVDKAHFEGFFEAEGAAGGHEFQGARAADGAGKTLRATGAGKDAKIHFGQTNLAAFLFGDANVAGEGDFEAAADGMAIESGDDELGRLFEAAEGFIGVEAEIVFELGIGFRQHRDAGPSGEEFFASAADDDDVGAFVHAGLENGRIELEHHVVGVSVRRGVIEFKNSDAVFDAVLYEFFRCDACGGSHIFYSSLRLESESF
jgi:hypothetical protein